MEIIPLISSLEIQKILTVPQWASWKRYCKHKGVEPESESSWQEYDFNEFMNILDIVTEVEVEQDKIEGGNGAERDNPLDPVCPPEANGVEQQLELFTYDHVCQRREAPSTELPLQEPSVRPEVV